MEKEIRKPIHVDSGPLRLVFLFKVMMAIVESWHDFGIQKNVQGKFL